MECVPRMYSSQIELTGISLWENDKSSDDGWQRRLHNNMNVLDVTEVYT